MLPGFDVHSRIGVLTTQACGALAAGTLLLAAATAWYDERRAVGDDFDEYPDFFLFRWALNTGISR